MHRFLFEFDFASDVRGISLSEVCYSRLRMETEIDFRRKALPENRSVGLKSFVAFLLSKVHSHAELDLKTFSRILKVIYVVESWTRFFLTIV